MTIQLLGQEKTFAAPATVQEILAAMCQGHARDALGCFCGGKALELSEVIDHDAALHPITYQNEEGRRIYERTLRFVLLMAVKNRHPELHLRIEHSIGYGVYMRFLERDADAETVRVLSEEMEQIVKADLPLVKEQWSRSDAIEYFRQNGHMDKVNLLSYRPYDYFPIYRCGTLCEYFYGAMLPSTGYVPHFKLRLHFPGMVLQFPSPQAPDKPSPYVSRPKILSAFSQSNRWCTILGCMNAADINEMITDGRLPEFIRINEALHDQSIGDIARGIAAKNARAVFVAGPSSSGKTTFSNRLAIHLRVLGLHPVLISLDDFYLDRDLLPLEADGAPDLEALSALDVPLLRQCLTGLLAGEEVKMPRFDFTQSKRAKERYPLRLGADQVLIMEGIHGLNPALHEGFDPALIATVYISELTCLNLDHHNRIRTTDARLLRRIVRDHQFRNTPPEETLSMRNSVRRGEEKWIFPYQEQADFVFNSALHYELPVLKHYAYEMLKQIPPENENYLSSRRLLKILHYILPAREDAFREIPPLSLLREFIGGCTLYESKE